MIDEESHNERLQAPLPQDAYATVDQAFATGWNDPSMDDYDRYEDVGKRASAEERQLS